MQATPKQPATRAEKLRWYAGQLMTEAGEKERAGDSGGAISSYLQASDILLLHAKVEENYSSWKYYADTASRCQKSARRLIASSSADASPGPTPPS